MMELYQFAWSPFCAKVRAILQVKGIVYKTIDVLPVFTQYKVRRASNQSKVPALIDDGKVIVDSTDIALYLEKVAPTPQLIPEELILRSECLRWDDWADEVLSVPVRTLGYWAASQNPALGRARVQPTGNALLDFLVPKLAGPMAKKQCRKHNITKDSVQAHHALLLRKMDDLLPVIERGPYLVGEQLTLADIAVCTVTSNLDVVSDIRERAELAPFFVYRDRILGEIGLE